MDKTTTIFSNWQSLFCSFIAFPLHSIEIILLLFFFLVMFNSHYHLIPTNLWPVIEKTIVDHISEHGHN